MAIPDVHNCILRVHQSGRLQPESLCNSHSLSLSSLGEEWNYTAATWDRTSPILIPPLHSSPLLLQSVKYSSVAWNLCWVVPSPCFLLMYIYRCTYYVVCELFEGQYVTSFVCGLPTPASTICGVLFVTVEPIHLLCFFIFLHILLAWLLSFCICFHLLSSSL